MDPIFIVGTGRCGSTIISEIVSKHEDVGFISNIDDNLKILNLKGRANNLLYRSFLGNYTKKGRLRFAPSEAYRLIAHKVSPIYENSFRDLVAEDVTPWLEKRFRSFFIQRYNKQKKSIFLHKYTGWSRIGFFSKIFPEAKFIHIIRDGRAVANSWLQMPWWGGYRGPENWPWGRLPDKYADEWKQSGHSFVTLSAISWKILMDSYELSIQENETSKFLQLRYEDFVDNPRSTLEKILSFSGLTWSPDFEKQFQRHTILSNRRDAYKHDLTKSQQEELLSSLTEKLKNYSYL